MYIQQVQCWHKKWRTRVRGGSAAESGGSAADPRRSPLESAENFFWWTSVDPPRIHRLVRRTPPDSAGSASGPRQVRGGSADPPPRSSPKIRRKSPPRSESPRRGYVHGADFWSAADFRHGTPPRNSTVYFSGGLFWWTFLADFSGGLKSTQITIKADEVHILI